MLLTKEEFIDVHEAWLKAPDDGDQNDQLWRMIQEAEARKVAPGLNGAKLSIDPSLYSREEYQEMLFAAGAEWERQRIESEDREDVQFAVRDTRRAELLELAGKLTNTLIGCDGVTVEDLIRKADKIVSLSTTILDAVDRACEVKK